ncbi:VQ MOTIF PROTEIN [Salix purpurea]|uniref:VQ MOTIF PROTEIN n=1 Tax=Salix purpurea TaxID=77065 RepID=A0A9Q0THV8_SALPP|nr:VQ MOTIF PROTEIN [Salix purpurea]
MASSSSDWAQLYEQADFHGQAAVPSIGFSDATSVATSGSSDIINPSSSITSSAGDQTLTPKGCGSKPIRRRSRASKKAPTTLLNASSANFRALVQQFTGCSSPPNSFGSQKGPINLDFGLGSAQNRSYATAEMAPFDSIYYHGQSQMQERQQPTENAQQLPQYQGSLDHLPDRNAYFSMSSDPGPSLDRPADDGLFNMDDIALQELAKESFSDENMNNIDCF